MFVKRISSISLVFLWLVPSAGAMESDQFMTWGIELQDAADAINGYFNRSVELLLDDKNEKGEDCSCEELTQDLFFYFFERHDHSVIRTWIKESGAVDVYPPMTISDGGYRERSVYRGNHWPVFIPVSRTVRIGEVYLGLDKIGHMFGFGSRYFKRYLRHREQGYGEEEAMEKVIRWGINSENTIVGKWADGVFSHGDLEANFQGFLLARAFCEGESSHLKRVNDTWILATPVDFRDFVSPGMDESYNTAHHWPGRRGSVQGIIAEEYCGKLSLVEARFEKYDAMPLSFSRQYIADHFEEKGKNPQGEQGVEAICELSD